VGDDATGRVVELAAVTGRIAAVREATRTSPLGRYRAGQQQAQAVLDARDALALTEVLRAVTEDRDGDARAVLDTLDPDVLTALAGRAARLADLAATAARGRR